MIVKENLPHLRRAIEGAIEGIPFYREEPQTAQSLDSGHGRIEERKLIATSVLAGQEEIWPALSQVFGLERRVELAKSGKKSYEMAYGVTSLCREQASGEKSLGLVRQHWVIERTFSWLSQNRRLSKDYERLTKTSESMIYAAMTRLMIRRLADA